MYITMYAGRKNRSRRKRRNNGRLRVQWAYYSSRREVPVYIYMKPWEKSRRRVKRAKKPNRRKTEKEKNPKDTPPRLRDVGNYRIYIYTRVPGQIVGTHCASLLTNRASSRTLNPRGNDDPWSETKLTLFFIWFFFTLFFNSHYFSVRAHSRYIFYYSYTAGIIAVFWFRRNFRFSTVKPPQGPAGTGTVAETESPAKSRILRVPIACAAMAEEMLCRKAVIGTRDQIDGAVRGGVTGMRENRFFRWRETEHNASPRIMTVMTTMRW